jgi:L-alanine-DL-glutamate epimerase-like enolase superfamily enzyme
MEQQTQIYRITLWPLAIPMKAKFSHAVHERELADPVVVCVELANGIVGWGETLPRPYVTGESVGSIQPAIEQAFLPLLSPLRPGCLAEALEVIDALPTIDPDGRPISAARAGVELALLDAYCRTWPRPVTEVVGWLGLAAIGLGGSLAHLRYSGVLSADEPGRVLRSLWKMRLFGLRDFKLKVGFDGDHELVNAVAAKLSPAIRRGRATLRLDANGGWSLDRAIERLTAWREWPIACIEQPLPRGHEQQLSEMKRHVPMPIMHDESLTSLADAEALIALRVADFFNIRLSKNGGWLASIRLAGLARKHGVGYQLGCMVGETSILSAAGRAFLAVVPGVEFAEGSYGKFLLQDDVVDRPVRFGYGGFGRPLSGPGWGVRVQQDRLQRLLADRPVTIAL